MTKEQEIIDLLNEIKNGLPGRELGALDTDLRHLTMQINKLTSEVDRLRDAVDILNKKAGH